MIGGVSNINPYQGVQSFEAVRALNRVDLQLESPLDSVNVQQPQLISDLEAQEALAAVEEDLSLSSAEALSVHGGLDFDRVMALLAD
ncbi:MAG: hypothetical protein IJS50_06090 [Desulfovibrio sp.]|nr:hypothetical protein [Desulfovibrio sp.]